METKDYELLLIAVPSDSKAEDKIYNLVGEYRLFALGMSIDLEDSAKEDLEELMRTILAEGCKKYGLKTE